MIDFIKEPHTNISIGQTGCGKTHLVLELIEKEFKHFDYIVIICPTLRENKTHHAKGWIKNDDKVWLVDPKTISINGLKSCQNCYDSLKYYLTSVISSLIKTLIRGGSPY